LFAYAETAALEYARFQAGFTVAAVIFNSNSSEQAASSNRYRSVASCSCSSSAQQQQQTADSQLQ